MITLSPIHYAEMSDLQRQLSRGETPAARSWSGAATEVQLSLLIQVYGV